MDPLTDLQPTPLSRLIKKVLYGKSEGQSMKTDAMIVTIFNAMS